MTTRDPTKGSATHVAPANINSIILDLVSCDKTARYRAVETTMTKTRAGTLSTKIQTTTGVRSRSVMRNSIKALAMLWMRGLEER